MMKVCIIMIFFMIIIDGCVFEIFCRVVDIFRNVFVIYYVYNLVVNSEQNILVVMGKIYCLRMWFFYVELFFVECIVVFF